MKGNPVPVVYCLLDPGTDIQYIRIGRTYHGDSTLMESPPVKDSLVWQEQMDVYMEEYQAGTLIKTFDFLPAANAEKDSGFYPKEALALWSGNFRPEPGNEYRLYVYFADLDMMVTAKTTAHGLPAVVDPMNLPGRKVNFEAGQPFIARWYPGAYTGVYELIFRIHYQDSTGSGIRFRYADYSSGGIYDIRHNQLVDHPMGGPSFFKAMASQIPDTDTITRRVISAEFIMVTGGLDLSFYYRSVTDAGTNFTNFLDFTNLVNGVGVFASRSITKVSNLELSNVTIDELAHGSETSHLGFKDSRGQ